MVYDFLTAAFPWIVMGIALAIVCANGDKWFKASNNSSEKSNSDKTS